jgi:hypothetical protein
VAEGLRLFSLGNSANVWGTNLDQSIFRFENSLFKQVSLDKSKHPDEILVASVGKSANVWAIFFGN